MRKEVPPAKTRIAPAAKAERVGSRESGRGVVDDCVRGGMEKDVARSGGAGLIDVVRRGLPVGELADLQASLEVPMERLATLLGISKATLHRRKLSGRLDPSESDRVVRFARLMGKAVEVFEHPEAARRWLRSPQVGLGGAVPLDYSETEVGAREVEDLLGRIEHGVYS